MTKHPLDRVESALVDASNELQGVLSDSHDVALHLIDLDIDSVLRKVQAAIRYDLDPPDPRD